MNKLIIFPTKRQIQYLAEHNSTNEIVYVVLRDEEIFAEGAYRSIECVRKDDIPQINKLREMSFSVLCCHEEGIYWLRCYSGEKWNIGFDRSYLGYIEKDKIKVFFSENNINNTPFCYDKNRIPDYPVVAKPIVGFGSLGVKLLDSSEQAEAYINDFENLIERTPISSYQKKYFSDTRNICIFEKAVNGTFFRTPFVVVKKECLSFFPVKGISCSNKNQSDFRWSEFELDINDTMVNRNDMRLILNKLADIFALRDGVYVAEFIQGDDSSVYLLEFSPRQTSERIGHIVALSVGIDMEIQALEMFNNSNTALKIKKNADVIRLKLDCPIDDNRAIHGYELLESDKDSSLYEKNMRINYYKKEHNNEKV